MPWAFLFHCCRLEALQHAAWWHSGHTNTCVLNHWGYTNVMHRHGMIRFDCSFNSTILNTAPYTALIFWWENLVLFVSCLSQECCGHHSPRHGTMGRRRASYGSHRESLEEEDDLIPSRCGTPEAQRPKRGASMGLQQTCDPCPRMRATRNIKQ